MSSSTPVAASSVLTPHHPVDDPVVSARNLTKVYGRGSGAVTALDSVNVDIARARFTAIMGPSGSGKSTLMHCLAGLDSITSGEIMLDGDMVSSMPFGDAVVSLPLPLPLSLGESKTDGLRDAAEVDEVASV